MEAVPGLVAQVASPPAPVPSVPEVLGLDEAATAGFLREQRRVEDAAAAAQLRAVAHFVDLHPVGSQHLCPAPGREGALVVAGPGATLVAEFALAQIAPVLGMSERSVRRLVGQAIELRDRLPRIWGRVMAGDLPPWRARRIAEQTMSLRFEAAAAVDAALASFAHRVSMGRVQAAVDAAALRHDPEVAEQAAHDAADARGVDFTHHLEGVTTLTALLSTPDAVALETSVRCLAGALFVAGDTSPHHVRQATALGMLADPQGVLDLLTPSHDTAGNSPGQVGPVRRGPVFHLHLHVDAIASLSSGARPGEAPSETQVRGLGGPANGRATSETGHVARVECTGHQLGPRSVTAVERWLAQASPGATVTVTPVIDLADVIAVDAYEIPQRLRDQVTERDPVCLFPWCGRRGSHDLDHIEPYLDPDDGGPPGQTSTANMARLCRFHHRVKTHHPGWSYQRIGPTTVLWRSPLGALFTVDHTGTHREN